MILLPDTIRFALRVNDINRRAAASRDMAAPDPVPVLKLFNPVGAATWIATELGEDGDVLFGLADLGFGCPELGYFSLSEIASVRLPFGLFIERDKGFSGHAPLSRWAELARGHSSILTAERILRGSLSNELPSDPADDGSENDG